MTSSYCRVQHTATTASAVAQGSKFLFKLFFLSDKSVSVLQSDKRFVFQFVFTGIRFSRSLLYAKFTTYHKERLSEITEDCPSLR